MSTRVLVVDDEDTLRMVISQVLEEDGYDVTTAASGEEFVALLPEAAKEQASAYAELVRSQVEAATFQDGHGRNQCKVTISLGVSTFPEDGSNSKSLLEYADRALYQAKEKGRNRVCVHGTKTRVSGAST